MRDKPGSSLESVATAVQRLSVLLAGGVAPGSTWGYLAERADASAVLQRVARDVGSGRDASTAIVQALNRRRDPDDGAWRALAAAWAVATDAGAPLAPALDAFAGSLRSLAQVQRDQDVALAGPVATARMVMILPVVAVLFGIALGFDTVGTLFGSLPGLGCLVVGLALMGVARSWTARLVASARLRDLAPGLSLDLMAIAVTGGGSLERARTAVERARERAGIVGEPDAALDDILELSQRAGVPAAALLASEAGQVRRLAKAEGERRAASLAVTLMLPLGVCVLPAFMLLGVAPLLISVVTSTVTSL